MERGSDVSTICPRHVWKRGLRLGTGEERGCVVHPVYNLVTSTVYYARAYLTGEARPLVSINSSSQDINVLYIVRSRNRFSRG